jgi:DNA polymerase-3 subunit chi
MSTPRIAFYFNVDHRTQYACRLVRKVRGQGQTVLVHCRDAQRLERFDTALWTFSALDFLPHVPAHSPLAARTPILLTGQGAAAPARDVLLMLDDALPDDFTTWAARHPRIVEIVSHDDDERRVARDRFRSYKALGFAPETIDVGTEARSA